MILNNLYSKRHERNAQIQARQYQLEQTKSLFLHVFGEELREAYQRNTNKELEAGFLYKIKEESQFHFALTPLTTIRSIDSNGDLDTRLSSIQLVNPDKLITRDTKEISGKFFEYLLEQGDIRLKMPLKGTLYFGEPLPAGEKIVVKGN